MFLPQTSPADYNILWPRTQRDKLFRDKRFIDDITALIEIVRPLALLTFATIIDFAIKFG